ncbi:hypothetical protein [Nocardia xishanensis]|uniref:hypothetical protein n=1 Tax=Nocardia xishanensis TaxID=238964 RepID=UPI00344569BA
MATRGWFNHYDDPDEFWDDEPLERRSAAPPHKPPAAHSPAPATSPPKAEPFPTVDPQPISRSVDSSPSTPMSREVLPNTEQISENSTGEDSLAKTLRFHAYMRETQRLLGSVTASIPQQVIGFDRTRTVSITLGLRKEFLEAQVVERWEQRLSASELGKAVVDAARDAERSHAIGGANIMVDSGLLGRLESISAEDFPAEPIAAPVVPDSADGVQSLSEWADAVLELADETTNSQGNDSAIVGHSEESEGWVSVTLTQGGVLIDCAIGPYWAAGRSGSSIARAINEAATEAQRRLGTISGDLGKLSQADQIIADAIALILNSSQ